MRRPQPDARATPGERSDPGSEARRLRARLTALTEEASRNDSLLRKTQERELELLLAPQRNQREAPGARSGRQ